MKLTPSIRRSGTCLHVFNGAGHEIAVISENDITTRRGLTLAELKLVNLVAENFDLFYENVIDE